MKKALIFHQGALGDVVLTFPAISALRRNFSTVDGICQGQIGQLAVHLGIFDRFWAIESSVTASLFAGTPDARAAALVSGYDLMILFSNSETLASAVRKATTGEVYMIPSRPPVGEPVHVADYLIRSCAERGILDKTRGLEIRKRAPRRTKEKAAPTVLIHPGSGSERKNWPVDHFLKLAEMLNRKGFVTEFILGPADGKLAAVIRNSRGFTIHRPENLIDLAALLQTATGFVGNDSGVSHLAGYLGIAAVTVFGPSDPVRWRPLGVRVRVVASSWQPDLPDCSPCFEMEGEDCASLEWRKCLAAISAERVFDAVMELFRQQAD